MFTFKAGKDVTANTKHYNGMCFKDILPEWIDSISVHFLHVSHVFIAYWAKYVWCQSSPRFNRNLLTRLFHTELSEDDANQLMDRVEQCWTDVHE